MTNSDYGSYSSLRCGFVAALVMLLLCAPAFAYENQLAGHASPYLAMHAEDPVAWQDWDPAILERAQKEGRLIFISSGYFSCHWCHVMQRESYRDSEIAALLNAHFIPVKVDRELDPALDGYLIDYLERTQGQAGWPLNIFLTPQGYPLIGATYLPPERFEALLLRLQSGWENQPDRMRNLARRVLLELTMDKPLRDMPVPTIDQLRRRLVNQALAVGDVMEGGFGDQNKFPMTPQLESLLRLRSVSAGGDIDYLLTLTLDQMAAQGLRDQLGGGFFRYTVDPSWQVPHFEKMLYTQAQLARLYLTAAQAYGRPVYLDVARDTLDFVLREMRGPQGMFISSFSAVDETGDEGAYYLWRGDELQSLLGDADTLIAQWRWALTGPPLLDGGWLPRQGESAAQIAIALEQEEGVVRQRMQAIREKLLQRRSQRSLPADTKELAGWNGLLLGALAVAGEQLDEPVYLDEATRLAGTIKERLWQDGDLWRARADEQPVGRSGLTDYAYLADGLWRLLQVRPDDDLRQWLDQLVETAWGKFYGARGWRSTETAPLPGMGAEKAVRDGALPAGPALLIETSLDVGSEEVKEKARKALKEALPHLAAEPLWFPSYLMLEAAPSE